MLAFVSRLYASLPTYSNDTSGLSGALINVVNWLCYGIGPGLVAIAISIFGFRLLNGDQDAWSHSKNMIIGSIVIACAGVAAKFIMGLSGATSMN